MKKLLLLIVAALSLTGCASTPVEPLKEEKPVTLTNETQSKDEEVETSQPEHEKETIVNPDMTQEDADIISSVIDDWTYGMYADANVTYSYETLSKGTRLVIDIEATPDTIAAIYSEVGHSPITNIDELLNAIKSDITFETIFNDLVERATLSQDIWGIKVNYSDPTDGVYSFVAFPSLF